MKQSKQQPKTQTPVNLFSRVFSVKMSDIAALFFSRIINQTIAVITPGKLRPASAPPASPNWPPSDERPAPLSKPSPHVINK